MKLLIFSPFLYGEVKTSDEQIEEEIEEDYSEDWAGTFKASFGKLLVCGHLRLCFKLAANSL